MLDGKLRRELLRKGLYQRWGMVDQIQQDTSGTGTVQTNRALLTVIIIAAFERWVQYEDCITLIFVN